MRSPAIRDPTINSLLDSTNRPSVKATKGSRLPSTQKAVVHNAASNFSVVTVLRRSPADPASFRFLSVRSPHVTPPSLRCFASPPSLRFAMAKIVWTPWRSQDELLAVRSQLYPPNHDAEESDRRRKGCSRVSDYLFPIPDTLGFALPWNVLPGVSDHLSCTQASIR